MIRHLLLAAAFVAGVAVAANAQFDCEFPGLGNPGLLEWNLNRDAAAFQQARDFAANWYNERQEFRRRTGYYGYMPGPVTTQQMIDSNRELQAQYARNNQSWHEGSNRQMEAVGRFADQGILGIVPHYNPQSGYRTQLPYGPNHYNIDPYGYARPGFDPQGFNVEPEYDN